MAATQVEQGLEAEVEALLLHEADLLDERRFEEWTDLFTDDGHYWVPLHPEQDNYLNELSIFFDDKELMAARVKRLRHPSIHVQTPPTRTCHYLTNLRVETSDQLDEFQARARVLMLEYREGEQRVFGGRVRYTLRRVDADLRIVEKRVDLVNCDDVFSPMAIPI